MGRKSFKGSKKITHIESEIIDEEGALNSFRKSNENYKPLKQIKVETVYTLIATIVMDFFAFALSLVASIFYTQIAGSSNAAYENYFSSKFIFILIFGLIFGTMASVGYRKGALESVSLRTASISYFMPIFAVAALWISERVADRGIEIERIDYFLIGISLVVAVNLLLNYSIEVNKLGFKWLVISFWTSSMIVLLRDRWFWLWHGEDEWLWGGSTDYYAVLGLSTTVFVLVLSFRTVRLNERTRHENHLISSLYWKTKALAENNNKALAAIKQIDESETLPQFDPNYHELREAIDTIELNQRKYTSNPSFNSKEIAEMRSQVDELSHSKARGKDIAEPLVLIAFGISTVAIALMTRPRFSNWNLFLSDMFSVLFASTICFMIFNLFDLRNERSKPVLWPNIVKNSDKNTSKIIQNTEESSAFEIFVSFLLSTIVVIMFLTILYGKWVAYWSWTSMLLPG